MKTYPANVELSYQEFEKLLLHYFWKQYGSKIKSVRVVAEDSDTPIYVEVEHGNNEAFLREFNEDSLEDFVVIAIDELDVEIFMIFKMRSYSVLEITMEDGSPGLWFINLGAAADVSTESLLKEIDHR